MKEQDDTTLLDVSRMRRMTREAIARRKDEKFDNLTQLGHSLQHLLECTEWKLSLIMRDVCTNLRDRAMIWKESNFYKLESYSETHFKIECYDAAELKFEMLVPIQP